VGKGILQLACYQRLVCISSGHIVILVAKDYWDR